VDVALRYGKNCAWYDIVMDRFKSGLDSSTTDQNPSQHHIEYWYFVGSKDNETKNLGSKGC